MKEAKHEWDTKKELSDLCENEGFFHIPAKGAARHPEDQLEDFDNQLTRFGLELEICDGPLNGLLYRVVRKK